MPMPIEVLGAAVLSLPLVQQSRLLDRLVVSSDTNPEWEEAWAQQTNRREASIESGRSQWIPGEDVVAKLNADLHDVLR